MRGTLPVMDGTDEDRAYIAQNEREARHLREHDEGPAENMTREEREDKAHTHDQRARERRNDVYGPAANSASQ